MKVRSTILSAAIAAALGGGASGTAVAQQSASDRVLEEVTVTASRRELSMQDVPISVVAMSADDLTMRGIFTVERLQGTVPNLNIIGSTNGGTPAALFSVRGIPRVGFYVDGVWQPYASGMMEMNLEDIERIEVLRGPQGTLYGRDSTGGAIRVITKRPAEEFGGRAEITVGNFDRRDVSVSVDVPLTDTLTSRWSASNLRSDGYVYSPTLDERLGQIDQTRLAGDLVWAPTERFDVRAKYDYTKSHPTDARISLWHIPQGANMVGFEYGATGLYTLAGATYDGPTHVAGHPEGSLGRWETRVGDSIPGTITVGQASLEASYRLTDNITLQSWTGYVDQDLDYLIDFDNSHWEAVSVYQYRNNDLFSQELQLSGTHGRFDWVAGGYYWNSENVSRDPWWGFEEFKDGRLDREVALQSPECQAPTERLGCAGAFGVYEGIGNNDSLYGRKDEGYALFGEVVVGVAERWNVTLGGRYHRQSVDNRTYNIVPGLTAVRPDGRRIGRLVNGDPLAGTLDTSRKVTFDRFTTRLALSYDFTDDIMAYASYSEGFNSGGADAVIAADGGRRLIPFDPETIRNYEIGMRSEWMDGRLRFNVSAFHTDWKDIQLRSNFVDPEIGVFAITIVTQNAAGAEAQGLETELRWVPINDLELNLNLGLLDTKYTTFALGDETPVSSGDSFAQAPKLTYGAGVQYATRMPGGTLTSRMDYSYVSGFQRYPDPAFHPDALGLAGQIGRYEAGDYGLLSARLAYRPAHTDSWEFAAFGTNLTNERVINGGFTGAIWEMDFSTVARPREYGVQLRLFF